MTRTILMLLLVLASGYLDAAPVPKEVKTAGTTVGTWRIVYPDAQNPGQFRPGDQYWNIDADCGVIFGQTPIPQPGSKPSEIFKFDPSTKEVDHSYPNNPKRNFMGGYEIKGEMLIIWLDLSGQTRPKSAAECKNVWHLQRVKETK